MTTAQAPRRDINLTASSGEGAAYPEDIYIATFIDWVMPEDLDPKTQQFGETLKLVYEFSEGDYAGEKIDELATLKSGPKAKLRQRAGALRGTPYQDNEGIALLPLLGKRCKLVIKNDENGFSKIADALPIPPPRAPRAAARPAAVEEEDEADEEPQAPARPARRGGASF